MGAVTALEHVAIQVSDVERSRRFYEEHLGFTTTYRGQRDEPYVQRVVGYYPGVTLDIAMLSIPGTEVELEILQYRGVDASPIDPAPAQPGTMHFSLIVDDLTEIYERLSAAGVEFVCEPQESDAGSLKGGLVVYMLDPDRIRVELVQPPAGFRRGS